MKNILLLACVLLIACSPNQEKVIKSTIKQGELLFMQKHIGKSKVVGCIACHSIKPNQVIIGPSLAGLSIRAPHLVEGETAQQYIKNSIINPDAYIVKGFLPAVMFSHYSEELSEQEIDSLVQYLSKL